ncbi:MAG TPA: ABC transporter permease [Alphaproteobacteria bacterium]|nr:ABC transporter permease [Alphaproteobacteria bacterium]HBA41352.1 ABC transporter permease [Alphaproteobacteria bacterium]HBC52817.1 ABC transporter permease [Alphaproteobacteria bacterium]HBF98480.1 ABC transporter permease [Alphaproteobacteria bacterium]HCO90098.1 ABC transporter permease [Alphaproteobacteria bacterium]
MLRYVIRRLLLAVPTLIAISLLIFFIIQLPPGDYLSNQIDELRAQGEEASLAKVEFLRAQFGFDRPFIEQYAVWVGIWPGPDGLNGLLQGNWGWSFEYDQPVAVVLGDSLGLTLLLNFATVLFIYLVAFPIGVYSATRQYSIGDYGFTLLGYLGLATPNFLLGLILLYYANLWFGLSIGGLMAPEYMDAPWSLAKLGSVLSHLAVPVIVIGTAGTAAMIRRLRANLLDELRKPYVVTARAKGLPRGRMLAKYPLRMALNPFIADIGDLLPQMVSGSVIVSVVLNLPTVGPVLLGALRSQDQYLAGFILMFVAMLTVAGMLISDLLLGLLDPRIRLQGKAVAGR